MSDIRDAIVQHNVACNLKGVFVALIYKKIYSSYVGNDKYTRYTVLRNVKYKLVSKINREYFFKREL